MGWLSNKRRSDNDEEKAKKLRQEKIKARKMFNEKKTPGDVELELDIEPETANLYYEEYLADQRKVLKQDIEDKKKRNELADQEKDIQTKTKKTKKKDYDLPFHVYKMIRDPNKPKSTHKSIKVSYNDPMFAESQPKTYYDFEDFAKENGDGDYIVVDNKETYVTTVKIKNMGFTDPMDNMENDDDDDTDDESPYPQYPQYPQVPYPQQPPDNGKRKGKKGQQSPYPPYGQYPGTPYDPMMAMANPGNIERMVESQEQRKGQLTHLAELYMERGLPTHAEHVLQMLDRMDRGFDKFYSNKDDKDKSIRTLLKEELKDVEEIGTMMGMSRGTEPSKMAEGAKAFSEIGTTFGKEIVKPLVDGWKGRKEDELDLENEITDDILFESQQQQPPMLPPATNPAAPPAPPQKKPTTNVLGSFRGQPQQQQQQQQAPTQSTEKQKMNELDEELGSFSSLSEDEMEGIDMNEQPKPINKLDLSVIPTNIQKRKMKRQINIEKLSPGEEYIINKAIPQWLRAWKNGVLPEKIATIHFNRMTSWGARIFVSEAALREAYHMAKEGYQTYLDMFEPYQLSLDPIYKQYKDYGRKGLETGWTPDDPEITVDRMIKILGIYKKIKPMVLFLQMEKGAQWFDQYLATLVKHFHKKWGKPKLRKLKAQPPAPAAAAPPPEPPAPTPPPETEPDEGVSAATDEEVEIVEDNDDNNDDKTETEVEDGEETEDEGSEETGGPVVRSGDGSGSDGAGDEGEAGTAPAAAADDAAETTDDDGNDATAGDE